MTEYREIRVKKKRHGVRAQIPERSDTAEIVQGNADTRIARNSDTRVTRNGDTRIAHNTSVVYPRVLRVRKRNFTIKGKVNNG